MRSGLQSVGALRSGEQDSEEPVALETAVIATGARPGGSGAKRELFTEETQTVLVFERGAVIRLSAGVADGQLLFLTNKKTGKEVVTQVVRKRSFRPTSCYVDLEFSEPSPGFWGIEFPKAAPGIPTSAATVSGEDEDSGSTKHASVPDATEVERLKREVSELQTQLKTLTSGAQDALPLAKSPQQSAGGPAADDQRKHRHEEKRLQELLAQAAEQEKLHGPARLVAYPKKSVSAVVKTAGKVATAGAFAAVLVAAGVAAYRFGLLDSWIGKLRTSKASTVGLPSSTQPLPAATATGVASPENRSPDPLKKNEGKNAAAVGVPEKNAAKLPTGSNPVDTAEAQQVLPAAGDPSARTDKKKSASGMRRGLVGISSTRGVTPSGGMAPAPNDADSASTSDYNGPKLVRSVKSVSPPEALRNYLTGTVNVDALVDATGHVKSVTVLSGPQKLHTTAVEQMKEYVYEPARKNGKPVPSHVQVSLQYWYEP